MDCDTLAIPVDTSVRPLDSEPRLVDVDSDTLESVPLVVSTLVDSESTPVDSVPIVVDREPMLVELDAERLVTAALVPSSEVDNNAIPDEVEFERFVTLVLSEFAAFDVDIDSTVMPAETDATLVETCVFSASSEVDSGAMEVDAETDNAVRLLVVVDRLPDSPLTVVETDATPVDSESMLVDVDVDSTAMLEFVELMLVFSPAMLVDALSE
jgi:pilus assembly protein FimV